MPNSEIAMTNGPAMTVVQHFAGAPAPQPSDATLDGSIPLRAAKYCLPLVAANGHGLSVFPPADMVLYWDGNEVLWRLADAEEDEWELLSQPVPFPGYSESWSAQTEVDHPPPSFLSALEPGFVQLWPGITVQTNPGWAVLLRGAVNRTRSSGIEVLEGIVETSWFGGPLATVIRLTATDRPITLSKSIPLLSLWPIATTALSETNHTIRSRPDQADVDRLTDSLAARSQRGEPGHYRRQARQENAVD